MSCQLQTSQHLIYFFMDPSISEKFQINLIKVFSRGCIFVDELILNPHLFFSRAIEQYTIIICLKANIFSNLPIKQHKNHLCNSKTRLAYCVLSLSLKPYSSVKEHSTFLSHFIPYQELIVLRSFGTPPHTNFSEIQLYAHLF